MLIVTCKMHDLDARTIRDAIQSPYGQPCIDGFFAALREVQQIAVKMEDGSIVTVTSLAQARALLTFLGWTPPPPAGGSEGEGRRIATGWTWPVAPRKACSR